MSVDPTIEVLQQEVKVRLQVIEDLKRDNLRQQEIIQRASSVTAQLRDESTIMNAQLYSLVKAFMLMMGERDIVISKATLINARFMKLEKGSEVGIVDGDLSFKLSDMTPKEREIEEGLGRRREDAEKRITPKKKD